MNQEIRCAGCGKILTVSLPTVDRFQACAFCGTELPQEVEMVPTIATPLPAPVCAEQVSATSEHAVGAAISHSLTTSPQLPANSTSWIMDRRDVIRAHVLLLFVITIALVTLVVGPRAHKGGLVERPSPDELPLAFVLLLHLITFGIATLILSVPAIFFLSAAPVFLPPSPERRRPAWRSVIAGGLMAGVLVMGFVISVVGGIGLILDAESRIPLSVALILAITGILGVTTWVYWIVIFGFHFVGLWSQSFHRMYRTLLHGTALELIITIPIDVAVRRKTDCYCVSGTIVGMAICLALGLVVFGPGLLLLISTRFAQRMSRRWFCPHCGQDMRLNSEAGQCVRCGKFFNVHIVR